jgi:hypothetical protein
MIQNWTLSVVTGAQVRLHLGGHDIGQRLGQQEAEETSKLSHADDWSGSERPKVRLASAWTDYLGGN